MTVGAMGTTQAVCLADAPIAHFCHQAHFHDTLNVRRFVKTCGMAGYGRFWLLCEVLAEVEGHSLNTQDERDMSVIGDMLCMQDAGDLEALFAEMQADGFVAIDDDGMLSAPVVSEAAELFGKKRESGSKGGKARAAKKK